jgi:hypothetical protein
LAPALPETSNWPPRSSSKDSGQTVAKAVWPVIFRANNCEETPILGTIENVFDWSLDPKSQLAMLCLLSAFVCWNNNTLFFLFSAMALFSRILE